MTPNYASDISPIVLDIETTGLENAGDYLEPVSPAKNLVDPAKVKADIEKRTAERDEKVALDYNVGRIAALGYWTETHGTAVWECPTEGQEKIALAQFWDIALHRTIVGFNIKGFDLRFLIQRSRYLGIPHPVLDLGKYAKQGIRDLYLDLTFGDGTYDQGCMRRTLKQFCRRFGLPVTDEIDGKDIPALVAAGDWKAVAAHCKADIGLTVALAQRLGVVAGQPAPVASYDMASF